ncbi:hypothetical protein JTB14_013937 [Gonioctena quinquepunctata]|nr:hypothetical protein JTB14_013937 [Gonioctena quinquepunctata]
MKAVILLVVVAIFGLAISKVVHKEELVLEDHIEEGPLGDIVPRVKRGTCDPDKCDSNCRYCFNGKCDCNHH